MKCSHTVSAEAQAKLEADEAVLHAAEHEIISGMAARGAELASNRFPNDSDLASMPPGHQYPKDTLTHLRAIGMAK